MGGEHRKQRQEICEHLLESEELDDEDTLDDAVQNLEALAGFIENSDEGALELGLVLAALAPALRKLDVQELHDALYALDIDQAVHALVVLGLLRKDGSPPSYLPFCQALRSQPRFAWDLPAWIWLDHLLDADSFVKFLGGLERPSQA